MCKDGERHGESRVSCPSTHHNVPGQGSNAGVECSNYEATVRVKLNELGGPSESREPTLNKPTSIKDRGSGSIAYLFPNDQYSGQIRMIISRMVKHDVYLRLGGTEM